MDPPETKNIPMNRPIDKSNHSLINQDEDMPFRKDAKHSFTMPARFYQDPSIYEIEQDKIFYCSWLYAGHSSQLQNVGDYLTVKIHEQSIFIIKGRSGELRGFYNVCLHRGHELLKGSGRTNIIVCPYHAWAYDYEGNLKAARNSENVDGFNKCDFTLKSVQVEVFCGMVFVNLDPDATSLKEQTGDLENEIRTYCPSVDDMKFAQRDEFGVKSNWKLLVDNFLECYHCAIAHKDFVDLVDMESYRTITRGIYSSQIAEAPRTLESAAFTFKKGEVDFGYAGWFLWPNLTIWIYPGEANLSVLQMNPDGVDQTNELQDWFLPNESPSKQQKDAMAYQKDVLQPEDISLCESVQRGLKSRGYNQGRFVVDNTLSELSEHAVHHFQSMVAKAIGAEIDCD
jgi:phenylpropionate dioxygenase-like ring-hydroxylating dioxygenase large terminal subunit